MNFNCTEDTAPLTSVTGHSLGVQPEMEVRGKVPQMSLMLFLSMALMLSSSTGRIQHGPPGMASQQDEPF